MNNYKACDAASEENLGAESKATFYLPKMRDYFQKKEKVALGHLVRNKNLPTVDISIYTVTIYNKLSGIVN